MEQLSQRASSVQPVQSIQWIGLLQAALHVPDHTEQLQIEQWCTAVSFPDGKVEHLDLRYGCVSWPEILFQADNAAVEKSHTQRCLGIREARVSKRDYRVENVIRVEFPVQDGKGRSCPFRQSCTIHLEQRKIPIFGRSGWNILNWESRSSPVDRSAAVNVGEVRVVARADVTLLGDEEASCCRISVN